MALATPKKFKPEIRLLGFILLIFLAFPNFSHALFGGKIESFTADQVTLSPQGKVTNSVKIYVTPKAFRMDGMPGAGMQPGSPKQNLTIFSFKDKQEHYIFNHDKKLYYQTNMDEEAMGLRSFKDAELVKVLGKEKVSGYTCVKKQVTTTIKMYGMTSTSTVTIWESDRFQMPLRSKTQNGHVMEIRNIDKGAPDKKYFKMPKGYKKVDNMMAAMGMDFGRRKDSKTAAPGTTAPAATKVPSEKKAGSSKVSQTGEDIKNTFKSLGDKLKNFSFGKD